MSDSRIAELEALVQQGDANAIAELIQSYRPRLLNCVTVGSRLLMRSAARRARGSGREGQDRVSVSTSAEGTAARLTEGPVAGHLVRLAFPMIWGLLAVMTFHVADTFFVGQLGASELAAMSFTFPVVMVLISVAIGLGAGTSSVVARAIGRGDGTQVRRLLRMCSSCRV